MLLIQSLVSVFSDLAILAFSLSSLPAVGLQKDLLEPPKTHFDTDCQLSGDPSLAEPGSIGNGTPMLCADWLDGLSPESWQSVSKCTIGGPHTPITDV
jgi:hypothetical protein